jgi:hypothetical protein
VRTAISRQPGPIVLHVQVLKDQGREGLAEEAEAALTVLLAPSLQPAALALEAARAAQVAENQRMAILGLGGLADSVALQAARATRIAENQARFASLGLGQATRELADAVAAGKPKGGGLQRKYYCASDGEAGASGRCEPGAHQHGLRGVHLQKGKWYARIYHGGITISLGSYATSEEAARAVDAKALELRGSSAKLNFPRMAGTSGGEAGAPGVKRKCPVEEASRRSLRQAGESATCIPR